MNFIDELARSLALKVAAGIEEKFGHLSIIARQSIYWETFGLVRNSMQELLSGAELKDLAEDGHFLIKLDKDGLPGDKKSLTTALEALFKISPPQKAFEFEIPIDSSVAIPHEIPPEQDIFHLIEAKQSNIFSNLLIITEDGKGILAKILGRRPLNLSLRESHPDYYGRRLIGLNT